MGLAGVGMKLGKTALNGFRANGMLRQGIENTFNGAVQAGKSILHSNEPMNTIKGFGSSVASGAGRFAQGAKNTAESMMDKAGNAVNAAAAKAGMPNLGETIKGNMPDIGAAFDNMASTAKGAVAQGEKVASQMASSAKAKVDGLGDKTVAFGKDIKENYGFYAKKALTADREDWGTKKFERLGMNVGDTSDEAIRNMSKAQLAKSMFLNNNGTISKSSVAIAGLGAVGAAGAGISAVTPSFSLDGAGKGKTGALIGASVGYSMGGRASDAFKGAALGYLAGR